MAVARGGRAVAGRASDSGKGQIVWAPGCPGPELGFYSVCGGEPLAAWNRDCYALVCV